MVKIEDGLRLQTSVSRREEWDLYRIRRASEEGSGGWPGDRDRYYLIWLAKHAPEILAELKEARTELGALRTRLRAADALGRAVDEAIRTGRLDSRSKIADARLDYGEPSDA